MTRVAASLQFMEVCLRGRERQPCGSASTWGADMDLRVRATAVHIEDGSILLLRQDVPEAGRGWSLPGGALEAGESLAGCLEREMLEETGLQVVADRLLYVADRISAARHVLHVTFETRRVGGELSIGHEPEPGANPIFAVEMVPVARLTEHGFTRRFMGLVASGFPDAGRYVGDIASIGL